MSTFAQCPNCGLELASSDICSECAARSDRVQGELTIARAKEYQNAKRALLKELIRQTGGHYV